MRIMSSGPELISLFGGLEENVKYFLELRACLQAMRERGQPTPNFDPRDARMRERLEQSQWKPRLREKLHDWTDKATCGPSTKQTALDGVETEVGGQYGDGPRGCWDTEQAEMEHVDSSTGQFVCGVQGCGLNFSNLASYESHYWMSHNYECANCKRSFVSDFLLDLHLQENHDSYFDILSSRIDMYRCLVESCELKFRTPDLRKDHLVVHHKYPASFSFHQPLKPRQKPGKAKPVKSKASHPAGASMDVENQSEEMAAPQPGGKKSGRKKKPKPPKSKTSEEGMECETTHLGDGDTQANTPSTESNTPSTVPNKPSTGSGRGKRGRNRVPAAVCFGRGSQRAFQTRGRGGHWHQTSQTGRHKVDIEQMDFKDIIDALEV